MWERPWTFLNDHGHEGNKGNRGAVQRRKSHLSFKPNAEYWTFPGCIAVGMAPYTNANIAFTKPALTGCGPKKRLKNLPTKLHTYILIYQVISDQRLHSSLPFCTVVDSIN